MDKEYIDREAAKKAIFEYICGHTMSKFLSRELLDASKEGAEGAMNELDYVPAADVAPVVHGEWINIPAYIGADGKLHKAQECSVCKVFFVSDPNKPYSNHPYCAECGAKMKGKNNGTA